MRYSLQMRKQKSGRAKRQFRAVVGLVLVVILTGCRQDMHNQPKFYPQRGTKLYVDGRSARLQVQNTVARGQLRDDSYFYTGLVSGAEGSTMPFPVTMDVFARGQERYNVYCTPCHSRVGNGVGMIVQRGYAKAGNFHTARLNAAPLGHFYNVIANGYGAMPDYSAQLTPEDRWAVVAYIRALQLSQNAQLGDVPAGEHPQPLNEISKSEGLPENFAAQWLLPPTASSGTPSGDPYVIPPSDLGKAQAHIPVPSGGDAASQTSTGYPLPPRQR